MPLLPHIFEGILMYLVDGGVSMRKRTPQRQLLLFPGEWVSWETLPAELHGRTIEVLSLLLQEALDSREPTKQEEDHRE